MTEGLTAGETERGAPVTQTRLDPKQEPLKDPLPRLKKELETEFEDLSQERIDEVAKHAVERLSGARVKEFVPVLAWRHARFHIQRAS